MKCKRLYIVGILFLSSCAMTEKPLDRAETAYKNKDYQTAFKIWRSLAEKNNSEALYELAIAHRETPFVEVPFANGSLPRDDDLVDESIPSSADETFKYMERAANNGYAKAQYELGEIYANGRGVLEDANLAEFWFEKVANQKDAYIQCLIGNQYYEGSGVIKRDYEKAAVWYQRAAKKGYPAAQYKLANMYRNGNGVAKNAEIAVQLLTNAANQGYAKAQATLAYMYENGMEIKADYKKALGFSKKAAVQGDRSGQMTLGLMYYFGKGLEQDYVQAYVWFDLANNSINRDLAAWKLNPNQVREAEKLVHNWKAKPNNIKTCSEE